MKAYIFVAPGYEEAETIVVADILERAKFKVELVSINGEKLVKGARGFTIETTLPFEGENLSDGDVYYIPGGIPGAPNLAAFKPLGNVLRRADEDDRLIAAICAGPTVLKAFGLADGVRLTSHSSVKGEFDPAYYSEDPVVQDGNIITARGLGPAIPFALEIVQELVSSDEANRISLAIENGPFVSAL